MQVRTDPDEVSLVESNSVTTPDVLRVELGNVNVLNDNVLRSVGNTETLAADNTLVTNTDDGLVGAQVDSSYTSIVVRNLDRFGTCASVSVGTPVGGVDGILTSVARACVGCRAATSGSSSSLSALEVELSVKHDTARSAVREPSLQFGYRRRYETCCSATSSGTFSEAFGCALDSVRCPLSKNDGTDGVCACKRENTEFHSKIWTRRCLPEAKEKSEQAERAA